MNKKGLIKEIQRVTDLVIDNCNELDTLETSICEVDSSTRLFAIGVKKANLCELEEGKLSNLLQDCKSQLYDIQNKLLNNLEGIRIG